MCVCVCVCVTLHLLFIFSPVRYTIFIVPSLWVK